MEKANLYGLIGRNIDYSFSKKYFTDKFNSLPDTNSEYINFDISNVEEFPEILRTHPNLKGLNVTIPYKEEIIPYLNYLSKSAAKIGAVNTIRFVEGKGLKGYNTDHYGFRKSLEPHLKPHHKQALIFGTGGAAKAVAFALDKMGIHHTFVSRMPAGNSISYERINSTTFDNFQIFVNCTPVGTASEKESLPIPYEFFTNQHIAFDLVYNPPMSVFLQSAERYSATVVNGYQMLVFQAEKAWRIWNK